MFYEPLKRRDQYDVRPADGTFYDYGHYRVAIAEDCQFRCVYCDCHEDSVGGREAMEMDHFRPWNKKFGVLKERKFDHLVNEPTNLVHACGVCNGFKWAHWPTENPDNAYDDKKGWIEPFEENRSEFLKVLDDGTVTDLKPPAKYQIKQLRLNRPLLKRLREIRVVLATLQKTQRPKWLAVVNEQPGTEHAVTAEFALQMLKMLQGFVQRT